MLIYLPFMDDYFGKIYLGIMLSWDTQVLWTWERMIYRTKVFWDEDHIPEGIVCHKN